MATTKLSVKTHWKIKFPESEFELAHDVVFSSLLEKYPGNATFQYLRNKRGLVVWISKSIKIDN